jgi:SCP-2 sterol transfer family
MADTSSPVPDPATFLREHVAPRSARRIAQLKADIARLQRELDDRLAAEATVQLVLEGGGTWYLNLRDGETRVADVPDSPPIVRLYQERKDWESLVQVQLAGRGGLPALAPELTRSRIERLRALDGAIAFRLASPDGDRTVRVQFGKADPMQPRTTVSLRAEDALRLQAGELTAQAAFMQGLVKLEGDLAFAMQVGTALFL